jgi:hypothetical protein
MQKSVEYVLESHCMMNEFTGRTGGFSIDLFKIPNLKALNITE